MSKQSRPWPWWRRGALVQVPPQTARRLFLVLAFLFGVTSAFAQGTPKVYLSAASTNCTLIVAGVHTVTMLVPINTTTTLYYLKLFDKATAPVAGTDTPIQDYPVPFGTGNSGNGIALPTGGISFRNGVGFCLTGGIALNDSSNAATGIALNFGVQ